MRRRLGLRLVLVFSVWWPLAGCSSSHSKNSATVPTGRSGAAPATDEASALEQAVNDYSVAYLSGDGARAFALLSARCKSQLSESEMQTTAELASNIYGPLPIKTFTVDSLTTDRARVTYTYTEPKINQTKEPWVKEGGKWLEDDC